MMDDYDLKAFGNAQVSMDRVMRNAHECLLCDLMEAHDPDPLLAEDEGESREHLHLMLPIYGLIGLAAPALIEAPDLAREYGTGGEALATKLEKLRDAYVAAMQTCLIGPDIPRAFREAFGGEED